MKTKKTATASAEVELLSDPEFIQDMQTYKIDHAPDGWPAVQQWKIDRLLDIISKMEDNARTHRCDWDIVAEYRVPACSAWSTNIWSTNMPQKDGTVLYAIYHCKRCGGTQWDEVPDSFVPQNV